MTITFATPIFQKYCFCGKPCLVDTGPPGTLSLSNINLSQMDEIRRKIRNKQQQLRRTIKRAKDPEAFDAQLKKDHRKYYVKHREREIAKSKEWNRNNRERKNANNKAYFARNKDRINENRRKRYQANKVEINAKRRADRLARRNRKA
ncbi:MAG: hypothetical protein ACE5HI_01980 [bacterium]